MPTGKGGLDKLTLIYVDNLEQAIKKRMKDINSKKEDARKTDIVPDGERVHSTTPPTPQTPHNHFSRTKLNP